MKSPKFKLRNYLLSLLFYEVLQHLKIFIHTNFRFERSFRFLVEDAWISKLLRDAAFSWRKGKLLSGLQTLPGVFEILLSKHSLSQNKYFFTQVMYWRVCRQTRRQMFLLVFGRYICAPQRDTKMAPADEALYIWLKRFPEYLAYVLSHRPDFWRDFIVYFSSFIAQILGFLYRTVWKQKVSPQQVFEWHRTGRTDKTQRLSLPSKVHCAVKLKFHRKKNCWNVHTLTFFFKEHIAFWVTVLNLL